jgi:hypothetical protein
MVLGVAIILVGIPLALYLSDTWGDNIPISWDPVSQGDLFEGDLLIEDWEPDSLPNGSTIYAWSYENRIGMGFPTRWTYTDHIVYNQTAVAWDLDGNGTNAIIVDDNLSGEVIGQFLQTYFSRIYWVLDLNASTISERDIWAFKFDINVTGNYTWTLALAGTNIKDEVDLSTVGILGTGTGSGEETAIIKYDLLAVLEQLSVLGEGKLIFFIQRDDAPFEIGETVTFQLWTQGPTRGLLSQKNITQLALIGITGLLGFMAVASTPLWDPLNPRNPGIVGRTGGRITSWIRRRGERRRWRRRRY